MKKIIMKLKNKKAITLISLVVTIVILVILAAVAINMAIGNNGLFNKAKLAKQEYSNAADKERQDVDVLANDIDASVESVGNTRGETSNNRSIVDFTNTGTSTSDWTKVASYPTGFTLDNCYISSAYILSTGGSKVIMPYYYSNTNHTALVMQKEDGIYMFWGSVWGNSSGKIVLEKY